jgi:hypothetical protein
MCELARRLHADTGVLPCLAAPRHHPPGAGSSCLANRVKKALSGARSPATERKNPVDRTNRRAAEIDSVRARCRLPASLPRSRPCRRGRRHSRRPPINCAPPARLQCCAGARWRRPALGWRWRRAPRAAAAATCVGRPLRRLVNGIRIAGDCLVPARLGDRRAPALLRNTPGRLRARNGCVGTMTAPSA